MDWQVLPLRDITLAFNATGSAFTPAFIELCDQPPLLTLVISQHHVQLTKVKQIQTKHPGSRILPMGPSAHHV